ncbi:MAG TPA: hypothetical protein VGM77_01860 [Gemmatimonadales bacterium]|jgi:hypothetical protein
MMRGEMSGWLVAAAVACALPSAARAQVGLDTSRTDNLPVGRGQLPSSAITVALNYNSLQIVFIPLDERVLRLLTNDSYVSLHHLVEQYRSAIDSVASTSGLGMAGVALVSFHATAANTHFDPQQIRVVIHNQQYQAAGWVPLSADFTNQQLDNRQQVQAIFLFPRDIPVKESFVVTYLGATSDDWSARLSRFDQERNRIIGMKSARDTTGHH